MLKILFVCLGNICRSPLAEGLFQKKLAERNLQDFYQVDSCGTGAYHIGESPDHRTRKNAEQHKVILTSRARQFSTDDFENFDYIIAMDASNKQNVSKLDPAGKYTHKIYLMRTFDSEFPDTDVPDPYFNNGFQEVFEIVDRSVDALLDWLEKKRN